MTPQNMEQGEMKNLLAKVRQWEGPTASRRASMASVASLGEGERRVSVSKTPTGHMANMGGIMANMASTKSIFSIAASAFSMTSGFSEAPKDYGAAPGVNSPNETLTRPFPECLLLNFKRATAHSSNSSQFVFPFFSF